MKARLSLATLTGPLVRTACSHLRLADRRLAKVIDQIGPCPLRRRKRHYFDALASSIISQQLSSVAASTIKSRIESALKRSRPFRAVDFQCAHETLRSAGLSRSKVRSLTELACAFRSRDISVSRLRLLDESAVKERLIQFRGVGEWTADMFMIFALGRPDVCASGDVGLRRAASLLYGYGASISKEEFILLSKRWSPYRSIASWYLWRYLEL
jgi:DNA-3-methyladenine glycosylase II